MPPEGGQTAALLPVLPPGCLVPGVLQQMGDALRPGDSKPVAEGRRLPHPQDLLHVRPGEEVELSLLAAAVRVLTAREAAAGQTQLPQGVVQGAAGRLPVIGPPRLGVGLQVRAGEQGVVVQHFFKVGHLPPIIGAIAAEAAVQLVKDAAPGHLNQRGLRHLQTAQVPLPPGPVQQEQQGVGRGKLGRAAEAAVLPVKVLPQPGGRLPQQGPVRLCAAVRLPAAQLPDCLLSQLQQTAPVGLPQPFNLFQQLHQPQPAAPAPGRQIGSRPEGFLVRGHQNGQRPAAGSGQRLAGRHIYPVHVRPLLPVHLDGDKPPVQYPGHLLILKGLPSHDVAPVAGGVADGQKDRLVLNDGGVKSLLPPAVPVDGVFRVLEQVGGFFVFQSVFLCCVLNCLVHPAVILPIVFVETGLFHC